MNPKEILVSQPLAFWLSLIATLVSIISLFFSLENQRRVRRMDALQKRSQLLFKLSEVNSQLVTAILSQRHLNLALKEFRLNPLSNSSEIKGIAEIEEDNSRLDLTLDDLTKEVEAMQHSFEGNTAKTDPFFIEELLPKVNKMKDVIENTSKVISSSMTMLEDMSERRIKQSSSHTDVAT
jgi:uncharacterized protein YukE